MRYIKIFHKTIGITPRRHFNNFSLFWRVFAKSLSICTFSDWYFWKFNLKITHQKFFILEVKTVKWSVQFIQFIANLISCQIKTLIKIFKSGYISHTNLNIFSYPDDLYSMYGWAGLLTTCNTEPFYVPNVTLRIGLIRYKILEHFSPAVCGRKHAFFLPNKALLRCHFADLIGN